MTVDWPVLVTSGSEGARLEYDTEGREGVCGKGMRNDSSAKTSVAQPFFASDDLFAEHYSCEQTKRYQNMMPHCRETMDIMNIVDTALPAQGA